MMYTNRVYYVNNCNKFNKIPKVLKKNADKYITKRNTFYRKGQ